MEPKKIGRPVKPVPSRHARAICSWISNGKTLRSYCRINGNPSFETVYKWMKKDADFAQRIACAREEGHDAISEECVDIADTPEVGVTLIEHEAYVDKNGKKCPGKKEHRKQDMTDHRRLKIWTRMQLLAKWSPKYRDHQVMDMNVKSDVDQRLAEARKRIAKT